MLSFLRIRWYKKWWHRSRKPWNPRRILSWAKN